VKKANPRSGSGQTSQWEKSSKMGKGSAVQKKNEPVKEGREMVRNGDERKKVGRHFIEGSGKKRKGQSHLKRLNEEKRNEGKTSKVKAFALKSRAQLREES